MLGLITYGFQLVMDVSLELVIYMFVDVFTKNTLRDTSEVSEKRSIWLCEVAVLSVLAVIVLLLHHTPYVLATLTLLTLAYTQLLERVNFRYWWVSLGTKWEEFQQHEESMGRLNKMNHHHHHHPAPHQAPMSPQQQPPQQWVPNGGRAGWTSPPGPLPPHLQQQQYVQYDTSMRPAPMSEAWYPADKRPPPGGMVMMSEGCGPGYSFTLSPGGRPMPPHRGGPVAAGPPPGYARMMPEYMVQQQQQQQGAAPGYTYSPPVLLAPRGRELARPPLHPSQTPIKTPPPQSQSIKTRVMSALGMKTQSAVPTGLRNNGENLCFMNSVLQCLAHCPGLARGLGDNHEAPDCTPAQVALVTAVTDLLDTLGKAPTNTAMSHTDKVRQAASSLPGTMVTHPKHAGQQQQDAAEFLMWMLDALHTALDVSGKEKQDADTSQVANTASMSWITPRYSSGALNMLRFIYGDLTPEKITELKAACRKEIEMAGGVDVRGYAEPLQRLSDLEWLTYKETAQSVIDDMFTGQMVEALHCRACDRLTVDIQTFNILPVPITRPRSLTGLVRLEDCLATFGTVEELYGQEGLQCEGCNKQQQQQQHGAGGSPGGQHDDMWGRGSLGASPILPNGVTRIRLGGDTVLRRRKLGSDSAIYSPSSSSHHPVGAMSPIDTGRDMLLNDSGFQDNNHGGVPGVMLHRTSTPIGGGVAAVKLTEGQRRSLLRQTPECLILQLLRFTYAGGQPIKLHQPVSLPLTGLDLTPQIVDTVIQRADIAASSSQTGAASSHRYDLCGLCLHLGSDVTASGHYVAYGRLPEGGEWYRYDDDAVVAVNMDYELSTRQVRENAYLAFYRRSSHS